MDEYTVGFFKKNEEGGENVVAGEDTHTHLSSEIPQTWPAPTHKRPNSAYPPHLTSFPPPSLLVSAVAKFNCATVPMLIANNVIWSRFSKQPWWPCLTVLPNAAAAARECVPPNQATGARMRLYYFLTNERGEVSKSNDFVTPFEATGETPKSRRVHKATDRDRICFTWRQWS